MKKKIFIFALLASMILVLGACGNNNNGAVDNTANNTENNNTSTEATVAPTKEATEGTEGETSPEEDTEDTDDGSDENADVADEDTDDVATEDEVVEVQLGQYKNLEVTLFSYDLTEKEILTEMYSTLVSYATDISEGDHTEVQLYDVANIDFEGLLDGVAFDGGTSTDYDMVVGASGFIDGFDEGVLGLTVGDTVALNLTFPEDYAETTLAGQDVVFNVTVNSLKEITDASVEEAGTGYTTLADYKDYYTEYINDQLTSTVESQKETDLLDQIVANSTFIGDHATDVADYVEYYTSYYESTATGYGIDLETYLNYMYGMTTDQFTEELTNSREASLAYMDVLLAIAKEEALELSEDEYAAGAADMLTAYGYDTVEALEEAYTKESINESLLCDKALQVVLDNAVILED